MMKLLSCVILMCLALGVSAQVANDTVTKSGHRVDTTLWSLYPAGTILNMTTNGIIIGGTLRTNWPDSAENWALYAIATNLNMGGYSISNAGSIYLGGELLTNVFQAASNWYRYPARGPVNMGGYQISGVSNMVLGGEARTNWPRDAANTTLSLVYSNGSELYTNKCGLYSNYFYVYLGNSNRMLITTSGVSIAGSQFSATGIVFMAPALNNLDMGGKSITNIANDSVTFTDGNKLTSRGALATYTPTIPDGTGTYVYPSIDPGWETPGVTAPWNSRPNLYAEDSAYCTVWAWAGYGGGEPVSETGIGFNPTLYSIDLGVCPGDQISGIEVVLVNCNSSRAAFGAWTNISASLRISLGPKYFMFFPSLAVPAEMTGGTFTFGSPTNNLLNYILPSDFANWSGTCEVGMRVEGVAGEDKKLEIDAVKLRLYLRNDSGTNVIEVLPTGTHIVTGTGNRTNVFDRFGTTIIGPLYHATSGMDPGTANNQITITRRSPSFVSAVLTSLSTAYTVDMEAESADMTTVRTIQIQNTVNGTATINWSRNFIFQGATPEALTVAANAVDLFEFRWNGTKWVHMNSRKNIQ